MLTEDDLANIFETHDFDGNEPDDELNESSDSESDEDVQMAGTTDVQVSIQSSDGSEDEENKPHQEVSSRCVKIKRALLFLIRVWPFLNLRSAHFLAQGLRWACRKSMQS